MKRTTRSVYEKRFFLSLFVIVLILFAGVGIYNVNRKNMPLELPDTNEVASQAPQNALDQLSIVSGIVYRHLVAYNLVCTESGQPLEKYPAYFSAKYADDIRRIDRAWNRRGKSLESVLTDYDSRRYPKLAPEIQTELIDLERQMAILVKAQKANILPKDVHWTAEDENKLNIKDACLLFDDAAPEIGEKTNFADTFRQYMRGI